MGVILTIILGGVAGWLASMIVNRNDSMGLVWNIIVGIAGAFLANVVIAPLFGVQARLNEISLSGFIMAVLGATLLLIIVNLFTRKSIR